jgi:type IV pilus assembly protein PilY1
MNFLKTKLSRVISSVFLLVTAPQFSYADDIDLYVTSTTGSTSVKPNVLFIIDNSGSMDGKDVPVTGVACQYDASKSYSGDYDSSRIYFYEAGSSLPSSGGDPDGSFLTTDNYCSASNASLNSSGIYLQALISFRSSNNTNKWQTIRTGDRSGNPIECQADAGIHGDGVNTSKLHASRSNNTKWTSTANDKYNWSNARTYSLYSGNRLNYEALLIAGGRGC